MDQDTQPPSTPNKPAAAPTFSDVQPPAQKPVNETPSVDSSPSPAMPTGGGTVTQAPVIGSDSGGGSGKKKSAVWLIVILVLIIAGAAGAYLYMNMNKKKAAPTSTPPVSKTTSQSSNVEQSVVNANNTFGTDLLNNLEQTTPTDNIFISPASISMALSMVYNGAAGSTMTAMQQTLDYHGLDVSTINVANKNLIDGLKNPDSKVTLAIANSVWIKQGFSPKQTFLNTVQNNYQAKATSLDFSSPTAPTTINNWVAQATNNKIPTIISQIPSAEVMYLINAVYFDGAWSNAFNPNATANQPFTTGSGTKVQIPTMTQQGKFKYYGDNTMQAIQMPYGTNQRMAMDVFLPTSLSTYLKTLSYQQLNSISNKLSSEQGTIDMPKFTLTYAQNLNDSLKALGMTIAFDSTGKANFSNIGNNLSLSDVMHKTYLNVSEQGTEAAAATSVGVQDSAEPATPPSKFTMDVNKPFLFTIVDTKTNELLFIGTIQSPSAQ